MKTNLFALKFFLKKMVVSMQGETFLFASHGYIHSWENTIIGMKVES